MNTEPITPDNHPDRETEWLLTNGLGGFAMGTVAGINTRRYHGLLVAAVEPPVKRMVCLHSTIDQFHPTGEEQDYVPLSTQLFDDAQLLHPDGWRYQVDFTRTDQSVSWSWATEDGVLIRRTLVMEPGRNSCVLQWELEGLTHDGMLTIRPMAVMRNFHELLGTESSDLVSSSEGRRCCIHRNGIGLILEASIGDWDNASCWWHNFDYPVETRRDQDHREHVFCAGVLRVPVSTKASVVRVHVALQETDSRPPIQFSQLADNDHDHDPLAAACRHFVVRRGYGDGATVSVIAGYPWFADWGRDSLISVPGLLLHHGRINDAISLLDGFASRMRNGIIPNRFDDSADEAYFNTADASLWFINAVHACSVAAGGLDQDPAFRNLVACCREIVASYRTGTDYGIRIDFDGLVMAGVPGEAVTWMDARVNAQGVTARIGKPVELSALWHNALCCLGELCDDPAETAEYQASAALTRKSFQRFWNERANCCYDLLVPSDGNWRGDERIRPNQVFAVSLPFAPLSGTAAAQVLDCIQTHLLTPFGLRTLSPEDPGYRGRYEGDMESRDRAYHNGTAWPWLLGPYCDGLRKITSDTRSTEDEIRRVLAPLVASLQSGCLGQIAEIYDGDTPQQAHGCPAQAWSVAEITRCWPLPETNTDSWRDREHEASTEIAQASDCELI